MTSGGTMEAIERVEDERYRAILDADVGTLEELLHPDFRMVHSSGMTDSKASYIGALRTGRLRYRRMDRSEQAIAAEGDATAVVFNRTSINVAVAGEPRELDVRMVSVWVRPGQAWRLLAVQSGAVLRAGS